jgi:UDPglucose 6-dehydrogenase
MQKFSVFGLGPVGLVTAVCFAKRGYSVVGIDPDVRRVEMIRKGQAPFVEPSLENYLKEVVESGMLKATSESQVNDDSEVAYITVGTPSAEDGSIDLAYIRSAAVAIGESLQRRKEYQLVVVKSTVVPGTARNVVKPILEEKSGKVLGEGFGLCSNPEFLREGNAIYDSEFPDRIVVGGERAGDLSVLEKFYREFYGDKTPTIIKTSYENAELTKYANNSFLAMKVSYINMVANICQKTKGADVEEVAKGIGLDKRIGPLFLKAGLGWGGSCFPKDLKAIAAYGKKINVQTSLVDAAITLNDSQPFKAVEMAEKLLGPLNGKRIAILGLSFKPDTDDLREAVSIPLIRELCSRGADVIAYDPAAMPNAKLIIHDEIKFATNPVDCISIADCCILVTEWDEFKKMPPQLFLQKMKQPIIVDCRRIFDPSAFTMAGVTFSAIGLGERSWVNLHVENFAKEVLNA